MATDWLQFTSLRGMVSLTVVCSVCWLGTLFLLIGPSSSERTVSPKKSLIWGPGLRSNFVVPARYFYIQAVDTQGNNFTDSLGDQAFKVGLYRPGGRIRVWLHNLDRHDGSYIIRYKLFDSYDDFSIEVTYKDKPVADSPYKLKGPVYHEGCNCPVETVDEWLTSMECPASYPQIERDLLSFPSIDMDHVQEEAITRFNKQGMHSLCQYVIKDNKVYRKTHGQHVGFKIFTDAIILSLTRKVRLPDMEFFINLGDWPLEKRKVNENPIPILSWCGSEDTLDIVMPTYDVTESTLETMGRVSLDLLSVQANTGPKWENKSDIAFWRGRDSRQERLDLVEMSQKNPDVIDARLTNMFFFKHKPEYGEIVKHISFFDFFKYKYQINLDGTVAAYRFPYLLAADTVTLKQESQYYEHFYNDLKPYEHYIPFKRDLSDLMKQLKWAKKNEEKVKKISENAQHYVRNNLLARDIFCYHVMLFQEYAERLTKLVEVREGMELVEQPDGHEYKCKCHRKKKTQNANSKKEEL